MVDQKGTPTSLDKSPPRPRNPSRPVTSAPSPAAGRQPNFKQVADAAISGIHQLEELLREKDLEIARLKGLLKDLDSELKEHKTWKAHHSNGNPGDRNRVA